MRRLMIALQAYSRSHIVGGKSISEKKLRETRVGARIDGQCSLFRCSLTFFSLLHQPASSLTDSLSQAIIALELTAVTDSLDLQKL